MLTRAYYLWLAFNDERLKQLPSLEELKARAERNQLAFGKVSALQLLDQARRRRRPIAPKRRRKSNPRTEPADAAEVVRQWFERNAGGRRGP